MNNILNNVLLFAAGAAIGSAVTWKLVKDKYEKLAQEEIDSVIAKFEEMTEGEPDKQPETTDSNDEYQEVIKHAGYSGEYEEEEEAEEDMKKPYVISPEEYGECDYATVSLTYYADGVLTNERGKIIRNVDELIGEESLDHFGEYEDDSVFVRNDEMGIDYEILKDYRNFSEIS